MNRCNGIPEIFEISKDSNGIINPLKAEAIVDVKINYDYNMSAYDALNFVNNFAISNGKIDLKKLNSVTTFFNAAQCESDAESKHLFGIIADETGKIDEKKLEFAINAFCDLTNFARNEVGDENGNILPGYRYMIAECTRAIIEKSHFKDGFNVEEAMNMLSDWEQYVLDNQSKLDSNIGVLVKTVNNDRASKEQVISIKDYISNNLPEIEMYDNNLYRLYSLLNVGHVSKNKFSMN